MGMRDLADPEGLGGFKVLIQERATCLRDVDGVFPSPKYVEQLPMPLLRSDHVPLYEGTCIQLIRGSFTRYRGTSERERLSDAVYDGAEYPHCLN